jgi:hypothetical protein
MKVKRCVDVLERRGPLRSAPRRRSQAASARSHRREPRGLADGLRCAAHRAREPAPARSSDRPGLRTGSERHLARPSGLAGHRVDASAVGLSQAREHAARKGLALHLVQADLPSYTLPQAAFDLVVVANVHFAPEERGFFFSRAVSAVAPGGHVFVAGHHLDSFGKVGPPFPERLYTEELLTALLAPLAVDVRRHERQLEDNSLIVDAVAWASAPSTTGGGR